MEKDKEVKLESLSPDMIEEKTKDWVELVRVSSKVDAVVVSAGSLLQKGGELVIRRKGDFTVVHLQHTH